MAGMFIEGVESESRCSGCLCVCVCGGWWGGGPGAGMFIEGGESRLWLFSGWI